MDALIAIAAHLAGTRGRKSLIWVSSGVPFRVRDETMASLLSTVFSDVWRPALIVCAAAAVLGIVEPFLGEFSRYGLFGLMDGEIYFRGSGLPWLGLLASAAASAAMLFAASRNLARQDF